MRMKIDENELFGNVLSESSAIIFGIKYNSQLVNMLKKSIVHSQGSTFELTISV